MALDFIIPKGIGAIKALMSPVPTIIIMIIILSIGIAYMTQSLVQMMQNVREIDEFLWYHKRLRKFAQVAYPERVGGNF